MPKGGQEAKIKPFECSIENSNPLTVKGMNDLRRIKGDRTKKKIMSAATKLMEDKGIKGLSTRNIARGAGLSQSSLYHHFEDLDAILFEVMVQKIRKMLSLAAQPNCNSLTGYFEALFLRLQETLEQDHAANGYFTIFERAMFDPQFHARLIKLSEAIQAEFLSQIEEVLGRKVERRTLELIGFSMSILREGYLAYMHLHKGQSPYENPVELARTLFSKMGFWMETLAHEA